MFFPFFVYHQFLFFKSVNIKNYQNVAKVLISNFQLQYHKVKNYKCPKVRQQMFSYFMCISLSLIQFKKTACQQIGNKIQCCNLYCCVCLLAQSTTVFLVDHVCNYQIVFESCSSLLFLDANRCSSLIQRYTSHNILGLV